MDLDPDDLAALRGRLLAFCYSMLGSPFDAEDAVQDTLERAWRAREGYRGEQAALSTWVHQIARNVCVDRLRGRPRRPLPRDLREASAELASPLVPALDVPWLTPAPTRWWTGSDPEDAVVRGEAVTIAVTALLQQVPARQRGVFVLREVLRCTAAETAEVMGMSVPAVNSALQRARAAVARPGRPRQDLRPETAAAYARAIEQADVAALAALVADDVAFEMPPVPEWSVGRSAYLAFMTRLFEQRGTRWRTTPTSANGQPGLLLERGTPTGWEPHTVHVLDGALDGSIGHVLVHADARLFALFLATTGS